MKKYSVLLIVLVLMSVIPLSSANTNPQSVLQEGLRYPYDNPNEWEIINGYNDGRFHGSVVRTNGVDYDYFYAYYGLDIARKDRDTGGKSIYLPADAYYFRRQGSPNNCVDFALGIEAGGSTVYLEMCHIDLTQRFVESQLVHEFLPRGTFIGTVLPDGGCPNCETAHLHMAVHLSPANIPWSGAGFDSCAVAAQDAGWCRLPIAFQTYAHFDLSIGGVNRPPLENSLFQVENQYCTRPDCVGGGSNEGNPTPVPTAVPTQTTGNSHVGLYENTNYNPAQYGWDNPTGGWVNVPDYMNERISSIAVDSGYSLYAAKDTNGGGTKKCFVTSYPDLSGAYWDDGSPLTDTISSVWVYNDSTCGGQYLGVQPGDTVTVWNDPTYWNTQYGWHDPFSGNVQNYNANAITSIGVTPGWSAVLYRSPNLGDGFVCFTSSDPDLSNNQFNDGYPVNDNVESIEIFHDGNCGGRMHAPTVTLTSTVTNIAIKEVTNHLVWSGAAPGWQHFDFGDGATFDVQGGSGDVSPTHQYANYGTYTVTVTVYGTDGFGYPYTQVVNMVPPTPTFSLTINSAHTGSGLVDFTLNWSNALADWHHIDFGDGQSFDVNGASGSQNATHIYNPSANPYTLTFTVKGLDGQNYQTSTQINMPLPTLSLTINSVDAVTGLVNYTAVWANAPIDSWQRVEFGHDAAYVDYQGTSDTRVDSHIFPVGTFTMTFTVNSRAGQTYQTTQQIIVTGPPPTAIPAPPTYSLTIDSVDQQTGLVTFTLAWSNALADWHHIDFSDGQSFDVNGTNGNQQNTHSYPPGTYTITFTVKGLDGQNYSTSQQVAVGS